MGNHEPHRMRHSYDQKEDVVFTTAADEDMTFVDWYEATGRAEIDFNTGDG